MWSKKRSRTQRKRRSVRLHNIQPTKQQNKKKQKTPKLIPYPIRHNLCLSQNRDLLIFGYINQCSFCLNIHSDIIKLIYSFFDYGVIWEIKDKQMTKFRRCKNGDELFGPTFKLINGWTFQLICAPNGWFSKQDGYFGCCVKNKICPKYIKNIILEWTFVVHEINYEYKRTARYNNDGKHGYFTCGFNERSISFDQLKEKSSLHISCNMDIFYAEFTNETSIRSIFCNKIPISFISGDEYELCWNFSKELLNTLKNNKYCHPLNKDFYNKCWRVSVHPFGSDKKNVAIILNLLKLPPNVKEISICYQLCAHCDGISYVVEGGTKLFSLEKPTDDKRASWGRNVFSRSLLKSIKTLEVIVNINVTMVEYAVTHM
eukprot:474394_1